jgi:hypothetical protein
VPYFAEDVNIDGLLRVRGILVPTDATSSTPSGAALVYRPGSTPATNPPNVFATWAAMIAVLVEGDAILIDDRTVSPAVIDAGTWDVLGCTISGIARPDGSPAQLDCDGGGVVLVNATSYGPNLALNNDNGSQPPVTDAFTTTTIIGTTINQAWWQFLNIGNATYNVSGPSVLQNGPGSPAISAENTNTITINIDGTEPVWFGTVCEPDGIDAQMIVNYAYRANVSQNQPFREKWLFNETNLGPGGFPGIPMFPVTRSTVSTAIDQARVWAFDTTSGAKIANLPSVNIELGTTIIIKNDQGANNVTVSAQGGETIDHAATAVVPPGGFLWIVGGPIVPPATEPTNWMVISK